jgi:predicted O-methyltransferase YrrM
MNYLGDLSKQDYEVLKDLALNSKNILEFGIGASTQILRNFSNGNLTSLETSPFWIDITKQNLNFLSIKKEVNFLSYEEFKPTSEQYDLIFNDGIDSLRNEFGIKSWQNLKIGGTIAYHDTRRRQDIQNVMDLVNNFKDEVESIIFNKDDSNITIVKKKIKDDIIFSDNIDVKKILLESPHYDWNDSEMKIRLKYGISINAGYDIPDYLIL